jgi:diadenosine tetraphosphate (Ap4A) HIT family hydrolase
MNGDGGDRVTRDVAVRSNGLMLKENCKGCNILKPPQPRGGVIEVGQHWLVDQYWGDEGFLGWLALQPREHCMTLEELCDGATDEMGNVIRKVKSGLKNYWSQEWPNDRFDRLYVTYFFDSVFDNNPTEYHLHIHLIPRTMKTRSLISKEGRINCWEISKMPNFPEEYFRYEERVDKLVNGVRKFIQA